MAVVSRGTVAVCAASASRDVRISDSQGCRRGRKWTQREIAIAVRLKRAKANGLRITDEDIAAQLGRSISALRSKVSRKKQGAPYRRVGPGLPGRRRRDDRVVNSGGAA